MNLAFQKLQLLPSVIRYNSVILYYEFPPSSSINKTQFYGILSLFA